MSLLMESLFRIISEKEDLELDNTMLKWRINSYEDLIEEILEYLCDEHVLAMQYVMKYKKLKSIEMGR